MLTIPTAPKINIAPILSDKSTKIPEIAIKIPKEGININRSPILVPIGKKTFETIENVMK